MFNILIIDDEDKIRSGIKKRILRFDLPIGTIYEVANGIEALDKINKNNIDIALVDINIPFLNGLEFIKKAINISDKITFIIISGYDKFSYAKEAIEYGVFRYILKPIDKEELKDTLVSAIELKGKSIEEEACEESPLIRKIIENIKSNYSDCEYSLNQLSFTIGLSESYISKVLKKEKGISFNEYLNKVRIEKSREIILSEGKLTTINEVAIRVGYSNQHYFSKVFKKYTNVSPSKLMK